MWLHLCWAGSKQNLFSFTHISFVCNPIRGCLYSSNGDTTLVLRLRLYFVTNLIAAPHIHVRGCFRFWEGVLICCLSFCLYYSSPTADGGCSSFQPYQFADIRATRSIIPRTLTHSHTHNPTWDNGECTSGQCRTGIRHTLQPLHYSARQV